MIHLTRPVPIRTFDAEATIALGRDRPELLAVAQLAQDAGRPIEGRDVTRELLGGLPESVGWRVIERCVHLGLLAQDGRRAPAALSDGGRVALEHGQVLVPEEGVFRFYLAADPLLDVTLLHVSPLYSASARETRKALYDAKREGAQPPTGTLPPSELRAATLSNVLVSVVNRWVFEMRQGPSAGQVGPEGDVRLDLRWVPGEPAIVELNGKLPAPGADRAPLDVECRLGLPARLQGVSYDVLWATLIESATGVPSGTLAKWQQVSKRRLLPSDFAQVPEAARRSFRLDVEVPEIRHGQLGDFRASGIKGVEVVPASERDAKEWLHWLQWDAVSQGYLTPAMVDAATTAIRAQFPHHEPQPLTAWELLARAVRERTDRRSWHLLAPVDLGLWSAQ